tara:strand:+ start:3620 stop:4393 length:774 start_codon:yes stop_codon:yes gene_type:complete
MSTSFNKKRITFISSSKIIKYSLILLILFLISFYIYDKIILKKNYIEIVQKFSENNNYLLTSYEINDLIRVDKYEINQIINKYYGQSIFLISLEKISKEINDLNWVKNVNLSNNFNNQIIVEILEYEPVGLYFFNNKTYYFSKEAKIIEQSQKNDQKYIIFSGKNVLNKAVNLLDNIKNIQSSKLNNIEQAFYINERRWDIKFSNELLLLLSEKNIQTSLNNYIKLLNQLNESDVLLIKSIDLRNNDKAIINFKKND